GPDPANWRADLAKREPAALAERVTWAGMLTGDLKWGAFRTSDAFVLPSHQENFGIAVTEALACGLPVLISDKVNIWREIAADDAGLVAEDTLVGTRRLLEKWLEKSAAERERMRRNAVASFARRFHIEVATRSVLDAMQRVSRTAA